MLIADAQAHIWAPNSPERPWRTEEPPHRAVPIQAGDLLREMDAAGVDRALLVPPNWDADRSDLALEAARAYPDRFAVVARPDTETPQAQGYIASLCRPAGMRAIRCTFTRPQHSALLLGPGLDWLWAEADQANVPVMVNVPHANLHAIDSVAARYPNLKIAIDHLGIPKGRKDDAAFRDLDKLLALSKRSNVCVKATALPDFTTDDYPYRKLHPYLRRIYDAFGPQRIFWGSDLSRPRCSNYAQVIAMIAQEIPWLTSEDKQWIMGRALCEWLNWV